MVKKVPLQNVDDLKPLLRREIVAFMRDNNLSQYDVAETCKLPSPYINQILSSKAKSVSFGKLCEVANKIGLQLSLIIENRRLK